MDGKIENGQNVDFAYLLNDIRSKKEANKQSVYEVQNNTILLKNIPEKLKDKKLIEGTNAFTAQNNAFVHVDGLKRTSYKINENGTLNTDKENKIDEIKIAPRTFQKDIWRNEAFFHEPTQAEKKFAYVVSKGQDGGNLEFISVDKDELLNNAQGLELSFRNYYNRHLALVKNNLIYDIFGIPS